MIQLTRLNNRPITVNSDLIKFIEQSPDTVITLLNGEKLLVLEKEEEVRKRIVDFRRSIFQAMWSVESPVPGAVDRPESAPNENAQELPRDPAGR